MSGYGLLYYINFCNQYIYEGKIEDKSKLFEEITFTLKDWLKKKFVTKRGKHCFDGEEAYNNFIAKRYNKK
jgi:hypothetical protein